jgi:hypothetical protein
MDNAIPDGALSCRRNHFPVDQHQGNDVEFRRENVAVYIGGYFGSQCDTELARYYLDCLQYIQSRNLPDIGCTF